MGLLGWAYNVGDARTGQQRDRRPTTGLSLDVVVGIDRKVAALGGGFLLPVLNQ